MITTQAGVRDLAQVLEERPATAENSMEHALRTSPLHIDAGDHGHPRQCPGRERAISPLR
jgi:hypothetical protein